MCPKCMQRCTASAIQTTEAFAETRLERTAVDNKQCRELLRLPKSFEGCDEIILLMELSPCSAISKTPSGVTVMLREQRQKSAPSLAEMDHQ